MCWSRTCTRCADGLTGDLGGAGRVKGVARMQLEKQTERANYEWVCQAITATEEACKLAATCHCSVCGKWFCVVHAEDEAWHRCELEPGDEAEKGKPRPRFQE